MVIKSGHKFHAEHGFTGSAGKDMRPTIPGFKHGGEEHAKGAREHFGKSDHKDHDGDMHTGKVHYDADGFQSHKKGGCVK